MSSAGARRLAEAPTAKSGLRMHLRNSTSAIPSSPMDVFGRDRGSVDLALLDQQMTIDPGRACLFVEGQERARRREHVDFGKRLSRRARIRPWRGHDDLPAPVRILRTGRAPARRRGPASDGSWSAASRLASPRCAPTSIHTRPHRGASASGRALRCQMGGTAVSAGKRSGYFEPTKTARRFPVCSTISQSVTKSGKSG